MTTLYDAFLPEVLPFVPGCPEPLAINAIRNAVIEFCSTTLAWREDGDLIPLATNTADYDISVPANTDLVEVLYLTLGTRPLQPKPADLLARMYGTDWRQVKGTPLFYNQLMQNGPITLVPYPDAAAIAAKPGSLSVRYALTPTRASTGCDDVVYAKWLEEIAAGAKMRLMLTPGASYANPGLAGTMQGLFRAGIRDAWIESSRSNVRGPLRVQFQRVF